MRVKTLYILAENFDDKEMQVGADALATKYKTKCGEIVEFQTKGQPLEMARHMGSGEEGNWEGDVGVYAIMHHAVVNEVSIANSTGADYVNTVLEPVLGNDLKKVTKIVLLACMGAYGDIRQFENDDLADLQMKDACGEVVQRRFLIDLIMSLAGRNIYPDVAGWDNFVSVLPFVPDKRSVYLNYPVDKKSKFSADQLNTEQGRKIVDQGKRSDAEGQISKHYYNIVNNQIRTNQKRTLRFEEGRLKITDGSGWSQRE